jgi:hypothetical protein
LINLNPQQWPESFLVERYKNRLINENIGVRVKVGYWKAIQQYNKRNKALQVHFHSNSFP